MRTVQGATESGSSAKDSSATAAAATPREGQDGLEDFVRERRQKSDLGVRVPERGVAVKAGGADCRRISCTIHSQAEHRRPLRRQRSRDVIGDPVKVEGGDVGNGEARSKFGASLQREGMCTHKPRA